MGAWIVSEPKDLATATDNVPAGGYFEELLSAMKTERGDLILGNQAREWFDEAGKLWEPDKPPPIRTEPVLHDPRPLVVEVHGERYHVHRVVYGQVLGCSRVDAQPGTILPAAIHVPGKALQ